MEMENSLTTGQNKSTEEPEILWMARKIVNGTVPSWSVSDKAILDLAREVVRANENGKPWDDSSKV